MSEPERPDMPIEGRLYYTWINHYERKLSDWFQVCHQRRADSVEWDAFCAQQFNYQLTRDVTP